MGRGVEKEGSKGDRSKHTSVKNIGVLPQVQQSQGDQSKVLSLQLREHQFINELLILDPLHYSILGISYYYQICSIIPLHRA